MSYFTEENKLDPGKKVGGHWLRRWVRRLHIHWWKSITGFHPDRADWYCELRSCRCGKVQYNAFATLGGHQWHDINDASGCLSWEYPEIIKSAKHHGLLHDGDLSAAEPCSRWALFLRYYDQARNQWSEWEEIQGHKLKEKFGSTVDEWKQSAKRWVEIGGTYEIKIVQITERVEWSIHYRNITP